MEIKKFNGVFGIQHLSGCELLKKNVLIYAPNGTMKSSFANGIAAIAEGTDPSEVDHPKTADYEIIQDSKTINQNTPVGTLNALVLCGEKEGVKFNENVQLSIDPDVLLSLALSDALKKKMSTLQQRDIKLEQQLANLYESANTDKTHKAKGTSVLKSLNADAANHFAFLLSLSEDDFSRAKDISQPSDIDIKNLSSPSIQKVASPDGDFSKYAVQYQKFVDKRYSIPGYFDDQFSINDLKNLRATAEELHYFAESRSFYLNEEPFTDEKLQRLIDEATTEVYGSNEAMSIYETVKSALSKAKSVQPLKEIVESRKDLVPLMGDYSSFLRASFIAKINNNPVLLSLQEEARAIQAGYAELQKDAEKEKTEWNSTIDDFNHRFSSNGFTAHLKSDGSIFPSGISSIEIISKDNGQPCSQALRMRLSTGEKDSLWILNCIFKIRSRTVPGQELAIILDDIADAFDYRNKYAISLYLLDLSKQPDYSVYVLSHSFDFFRTLYLALRGSITPLIAYKDQLSTIGGNVTLIECKDPAIKTLVSINDWKNSSGIKHVFALLPVVRSLEQLTAGNSADQLVQDLDSFLHFGSKFEKATIADLRDLFARTHFGLREDKNAPGTLVAVEGFASTNDTDSLYSALWDVTAKILNSSQLSTSIANRIVVGLFIRLSLERALYQLLKSMSILIPSLGDGYASSMFEKIPLANRSDPKLKNYYQSVWIGNCFVHTNSMIDAPLIDVGPDELFKLNQFYHLPPFSK